MSAITMDTRTPEVYWILGSLLALVSLASLIGLLLRRRQPANPAIENLNARIRAWLVMILIGGGALLAGRIAVILLFACVSFLALREFVTQTPVRRADHSALFMCFFIALPVQYLLIGADKYGLFSIWIPVYGFLGLAVLAALFTDTTRFLDRTAATQWGLIVCVYCVSHIPALMTLQIPGYGNRAPLLMVLRLGKAVRAASAGPGRLALEDGRGTAGRGPQRDAARRSAVAHHSVQDMAGRCYCPADCGSWVSRRISNVGDQARPWHQGLEPPDRRSRWNARPHRFSLLFGASVFSPDAVFFRAHLIQLGHCERLGLGHLVNLHYRNPEN